MSVRKAAQELLRVIARQGEPVTPPVAKAIIALEDAIEADTVEVPREPTPEMLRAAHRSLMGDDYGYMTSQVSAAASRYYRAMIAAAQEKKP